MTDTAQEESGRIFLAEPSLKVIGSANQGTIDKDLRKRIATGHGAQCLVRKMLLQFEFRKRNTAIGQ